MDNAIWNTDLARKVAEFLMDNRGYSVDFNKPRNQWIIRKNNVTSPVYINCRNTLHNPNSMKFFVECMSVSIKDRKLTFNNILGIESAGVPFAANVAFLFNKPFGYIRKEVKKYGVPIAIEGDPAENSLSLVIDDTCQTGETFIKAAETLKQERNIKVSSFITIVSLFDQNHSKLWDYLKENNIRYYSLTNYHYLQQVALERGLITKEQDLELDMFYADPLNYKWQD
jgi:orotate phosphoribosyltransferase